MWNNQVYSLNLNFHMVKIEAFMGVIQVYTLVKYVLLTDKDSTFTLSTHDWFWVETHVPFTRILRVDSEYSNCAFNSFSFFDLLWSIDDPWDRGSMNWAYLSIKKRIYTLMNYISMHIIICHTYSKLSI